MSHLDLIMLSKVRRSQEPYTSLWDVTVKAISKQIRKTNKEKLITQTTVW